ncbi:LPS assembly lipoprotein LptE [Crenobacter sp. SG2305]|uniref:LPS-assembly lipoprotein LptE n=1 Tax=Crenobacter oryzisoli TaxID=3056844 RepID=UPI0025AACC01|nr:LPS assembly lipoprotein LptE [Crenobacter sp. SG2305]MDN0083833.1 LPS assembly lipoprotein LptE [Crenobacter sp. SG2305]
MSTNALRLIGLLLLSLVLSACGFHLKGLGANNRPLPFASVFLDAQGNIAGPLSLALKRTPNLTVTKDAKSAEAVMTVVDQNASKEIQTINSGGKINEYLMIYRVTARVTLKGEQIGPDMTTVVRRSMSYSDNTILGKDQEEALLWNDMYNDAADQLVRRLAYLKRSPKLPPAGPQSIVPADAVTQP